MSVLQIIAAIVAYLVIHGLTQWVIDSKRPPNRTPSSSTDIEEHHRSEMDFRRDWLIWSLRVPKYLLIVFLAFAYTASTGREGVSFGWLMIITVLSWSLWMFVAAATLVELYLWYSSLRLTERPFLSKMRTTWQLRQSCRHGLDKRIGIQKLWFILPFVLLVTSYFALSDLLLPVAAFFFFLVIHDLGGKIRPPVVLLLGHSRAQSLHLQTMITDAMNFASVVSFLDIDTNEGSMWFHPLGNSVMRARDGEDWRILVRRFAEIVTMIIVDTRRVSTAVEYEMTLISSPALAARTLLVVDDDSEAADSSSYDVDELIRAGATSTTLVELYRALPSSLMTPDCYLKKRLTVAIGMFEVRRADDTSLEICVPEEAGIIGEDGQVLSTATVFLDQLLKKCLSEDHIPKATVGTQQSKRLRFQIGTSVGNQGSVFLLEVESNELLRIEAIQIEVTMDNRMKSFTRERRKTAPMEVVWEKGEIQGKDPVFLVS